MEKTVGKWDGFDAHPAIVAERAWRSKRPSHLCREGRCAGMYGLCSACYETEREAMAAWCADQPDPEPGEGFCKYWERIGGRWYDAWADVAQSRIREANRLTE